MPHEPHCCHSLDGNESAGAAKGDGWRSQMSEQIEPEVHKLQYVSAYLVRPMATSAVLRPK